LKATCCKTYLSNKIKTYIDPVLLRFKHTSYIYIKNKTLRQSISNITSYEKHSVDLTIFIVFDLESKPITANKTI